ncbi:MAG: hypothetical protein JWN76_1563 [Chitinophagaceae bacterium]|nr:hypothetical protein [Chitinophagaceae bacterium]
MQEKQLFEYAVIRLVPRVEREEFLNVGIVLYAKKPKFLNVLFGLDAERLKIFAAYLNIEEVQAHLCAFEKICEGDRESGPIGQLDMASRFRWLTATRSTVVQTSRVHSGLCSDPAATLKKLYEEMVL